MNPWLCNLLFNNSVGVSLPTTGQTFYASLKNSLVPEVGAGGPTWSRATAAWRFNDMGYLRQIPSGCAEFGGARKVYNTLASASSYSENVNVAGWAKSNCTTPSADTVVCAASNSHQRITGGSISTFAGQVFYVSFRATYVDAQFIQARLNWSSTPAYVNFDLLNGTYAGYDGFLAAGMTLVSPGVYDCWCRLATTYTGTGATAIQIQFAEASNSITGSNFNGDGVKSFKITKLSVVDVTNYDASYIPEYVSVGVLSAPYHGAGVDGSKYFTTDAQGAPIPVANLTRLRKESSAINNLLWSRNIAGATWTQLGSLPTPKAWVPTTMGSSVVSNGTFDTDLTEWTNNGSATASVVSGKMRIDGTAGTGGRYQDLTLTVGKTYLITGVITSISGSGTLQCVIYATAALSGAVKAQQYTASNTVAIIFTATATTQRIYCSVAASTVADFDDIAVTECSCVARTATGLDGIANTATTLTATAADAIILQPISLASAARCASSYVKRRTGTGTISFTQDGGSTWTDITSQINSSTWSRVEITATLANPSVGFKISTSGDAIDVDCVQNEAGAVATSPIVTTTATVTRNADSLTYQTASNWSDTAGTAYVQTTPVVYSGGAVGSATNGLLLSTSNSGATAYDGTNSANGPTGTPGVTEKLAVAWGSSAMSVASSGAVGTAGTYDGAMGLSSIGIGVGAVGYFGNVAIYNYKMTDSELQAITA